MSAPSPRAIETAMAIAGSMVAKLAAEHVDTDEDELRVLLREAGADVDALVVRLLRVAVEAEDAAEAVATRIGTLVDRKSRHLRRRDACRDVVKAIIEALPSVFPAGSYRGAEFTASVAPGRPRPLVTDEAVLPATCWRVTRSPDMTAIRKLIETVGQVPGVTMSNGDPVLSVRTR